LTGPHLTQDLTESPHRLNRELRLLNPVTQVILGRPKTHLSPVLIVGIRLILSIKQCLTLLSSKVVSLISNGSISEVGIAVGVTVGSMHKY
jgi:hypothetical protein